ncbi:MAG: glycosyltransferase [bacterium]|nr:glycosyltransferase [bacterium]
MNIAMFTNTFIPHVGGVANSVKAFTDEYRRRGHRVLVIAPVFEPMPSDERDVIRVPAIQNFNGSDFSVSLTIPLVLSKKLELFQPDIIHSHHPYLLGDTALRIAASLNVPLVFTHHTMYEHYTHYVPGDSPRLRHFVLELSTGYANLCDQVIAPSESVAEILVRRGVKTPISVIPTGVDMERFSRGEGQTFRAKIGIPSEALVIGYVGRLAPEKNLEFWAEAVARFLRQSAGSQALVVGSGPSWAKIEEVFVREGVQERLHFSGTLVGDRLVEAYQAMDIFVFTSRSETQGMVLLEAMAAGIPVVALDAPGVREVVRDGKNGRLVEEEKIEPFVLAISSIGSLGPKERAPLKEAAQNTAREFSTAKSADQALALYHQLLLKRKQTLAQTDQHKALAAILRRIEEEWNIWTNRLSAAGKAVLGPSVENSSGQS